MPEPAPTPGQSRVKSSDLRGVRSRDPGRIRGRRRNWTAVGTMRHSPSSALAVAGTSGIAEAGLGPMAQGASEPQAPAVAPTSPAGKPRPGSWALNAAVVTSGLAVLVLAFAVYLFGFTNIEAFRSQQSLAEQLGGPAGLAALNGRTPPEGQPVAILYAPAIGLKQIVVEGTSAADLELGPGLLIGSAPPGTAGNVVIAGRRTTYGRPFNHLPDLSNGSDIQLTGALGRFEYVVTGQRVVRPGEPLPASPTSLGRLTLVTSTPEFGASSLLVVSADLVGKPVATVPLSAAAVPPANFALAGDSGAVAPALLWGEALVVVLGLAWFFVRRTKRTWLVYALATPVAIALALLCFGNLAALLPATL